MERTQKFYFPALFVFTMAVLMAMAMNVAVARAADSKNGIEILDRSAKAFASVVKDVKPAVVHIKVTSTVNASQDIEQFFNHPFFERFFGPQFQQPDSQPRKRQQYGAGSGFIISKEGHILTNNHVVENAEKISVTLSDNQEVEAELVGTDPQSDVALIKINVPGDLPTITAR